MKGSCLCGGVTYVITGPIRGVRYCHCAHCRKFSGTAQAAWGLIETAHLAVENSSSNISKYNSGNGLRAFCNSCGSPLWYEPTGLPQFRGTPLGVIDDNGVPEPQMHVWVKSKVPWRRSQTSFPNTTCNHRLGSAARWSPEVNTPI